MDKILITGASGFIGTNVLDYFSTKFDVINIDIVPPKDEKWNKYWQQVDITDVDALKEAILTYTPDYILHLAARTDLEGKSVEDYDANITGVKNILAAAALLPHLRKIVITSSMLVCKCGYMPKNQFDYCPTTNYGHSKVLTEKITWENEPACDWAILRPTSIWGPWFAVPYRNFFDMVKRRMYFHVGHKSCTKTYGYVDNAVYQIAQVLFNNTFDRNNKVFYIGDNPAINIEEWASQIATELGFKIPRVPYWLLKIVGWMGDLLLKVGIHFPMSSFRLKNMTTDNVINLDNTYSIAPCPPIDRVTGIRKTLKWMENH